MTPNPETHPPGGRRATPLPARALGYQRAALASEPCPPPGWREALESAELGHGLELFDAAADDLVTSAALIRSGIRIGDVDPDLPSDLVLVDGPMRGPCRVVDRIDESLRQGIVVGTVEGNRAIAEHRCFVDLDPDTGLVRATCHTVWHPRAGYVLPGAGDREARAFARMGARLLRALGRSGTSGPVGR